MKKLLESALTSLAKNNLSWTLLKPLASIGSFMHHARGPKRSHYDVEFEAFFKTLEVQNGLFKGMKYPSYDAVGSSISPKLIGSYELELADTMKDLCKNDYSEIIDVGCAEGYYAIGLAMNLKNAMVYAVDTDAKARELCTRMAAMNHVGDRIKVLPEMSARELGEFKFTRKGLIISDCEGYEKHLFNKQNLPNLKNCDILIEMHEIFDFEIPSYLKNLFSETHDLTVIKSVDDLEKARTYKFPGLENWDTMKKYNLFIEGRGHIMEWLICRARQ